MLWGCFDASGTSTLYKVDDITGCTGRSVIPNIKTGFGIAKVG